MVTKRGAIISPRWLSSITFAVAVSVSGCGMQTTDTDYINKASEYRSKGDLKSAIIEIKNVLQTNPENGEARFMLGTIHQEIGDHSSAEKEFRKALEYGIKKSRIVIPLGYSLLHQGLYLKLLNELPDDTELSADDRANVLALRAESQIFLQMYKDARASLDAGRQVAPEHAGIAFGQARLAMVEGDFDEALRLTEAGLKNAPNSGDGWLLKGNILRQKDKYDDAAAAYQEAKKHDSRNVLVYLALASLHIINNGHSLARVETEAALKVSPNNLMAKYLTAVVDLSESKFTQVRDAMQQVLKYEPNHMPSVLLSGAANYALGNYSQADVDLSRFLNRFGSNQYARKLQVATLLRSGDAERALNALQPLLDANVQDIQVFALAGDIHLALREHDKASDYFAKASAIDPDNAALRTELGMSWLAKGETDSAIAELEVASGLDAGQYKADTLLVLTHIKNKDYVKALEAIKILEKKQADNPVTYNLKGLVYLEQGDEMNARKAFERALQVQPTAVGAASYLGMLDIKADKAEVARNRFEDILKRDGNNLHAMLAMADFAMLDGREDEYLLWLEKAAKVNPAAVQPITALTNHYLANGDNRKALDVARGAYTLNSDDLAMLEMLGSVQQRAGEITAAIESYSRLVAKAPKSTTLLLKLAAVQVAGEKYDAARKTLNSALEIDADSMDVQAAIMSLEVRAGRYDHALVLARDMQERVPESSAGYLAEGDILMMQQRYEDAIKTYNQGLTVDASSALVVNRYLATLRNSDYKTADGEMLKWLKSHPDDTQSRMFLASSYMNRDLHDQAMEQYQLLLQLDVRDYHVLNNLAWLYQKQQDARALDTAEKAYEIKPDSAAVMDTLGWILVERGEFERGVKLLKRATLRAPAVIEIRYHYAQALLKAGDKVTARKELERLLRTNREFPEKAEIKTVLEQL